MPGLPGRVEEDGNLTGPGSCPQCRAELIDAGADLAVPKRRDTAGRRALEAVLRAGLTYHGGCCGTRPGYRPRTPREVRERLALAGRTGMPLMKAPATADPTHTDRYGTDARTPGHPWAPAHCAPGPPDS
ncbi:hypothetical protein RM550_35355 [Streptomyces sp. DSM 41527]|uniref:Uncharacterized protein n=1 Tax=Streptomyces mooreae TaxID=3075523 RepID=A0ABU2TJ19_9ACTN|nr:hypothetical protein [Streptomyces sp. DSM 41527]MDT0460933.1 hypothetical protein [Streptomyces sp. DSM 41527]